MIAVPKIIRVASLVIAELERGNIQRQRVFASRRVPTIAALTSQTHNAGRWTALATVAATVIAGERGALTEGAAGRELDGPQSENDT